jgi:hypothetical protein
MCVSRRYLKLPFANGGPITADFVHPVNQTRSRPVREAMDIPGFEKKEACSPERKPVKTRMLEG